MPPAPRKPSEQEPLQPQPLTMAQREPVGLPWLFHLAGEADKVQEHQHNKMTKHQAISDMTKYACDLQQVPRPV